MVGHAPLYTTPELSFTVTGLPIISDKKPEGSLPSPWVTVPFSMVCMCGRMREWMLLGLDENGRGRGRRWIRRLVVQVGLDGNGILEAHARSRPAPHRRNHRPNLTPHPLCCWVKKSVGVPGS